MNQLASGPGDSATDFTGNDTERRLNAPLDDTIHLISDSSSVLDDLHPPTDSPLPPAPVQTPGADGEKRRLLLIVLISYASAVSIALVYFLVTSASRTARELESLPDVPPLKEGEFQYVPQGAALPPGHRLKLGDSRRFGHILVEPLRAEWGPVDFVHFSRQPDSGVPQPVHALKLWVRFTNLSEDQWIAPLDPLLVFKREYLEESDTFLANNFLAPDDSTPHPNDTIFLLDHPVTSVWNLHQQHLGQRLQPGESIETFLPAPSEGVDEPHGPLRWRMHFRKGYHPGTGHGVTTLVDVIFDANEIRTERVKAGV